MANKKQPPKATPKERPKPSQRTKTKSKPKPKEIPKETPSKPPVENKLETPSEPPTESSSGKPRGKPKIDISTWEQDNNLILLRGWATQGLSMQDIAHNIGISRRTLYYWQEQSPTIRQALEQSRELADIVVENALFTSAISGNVLAQIFWLKNRRPQQWRDKVVQEVEVEDNQNCGVVLLAPRLEPNVPPTEESEEQGQ